MNTTKIKIFVEGVQLGKRKALCRWVDTSFKEFELKTENAIIFAEKWLSEEMIKAGWKKAKPLAFGFFECEQDENFSLCAIFPKKQIAL